MVKAFLLENWDKILGIFLAYFGLILPIYKYLQDKRLQEKDIRFKNYHQLLDVLLGWDKTPKLDRQVAIIFEFRNFPEYYPVTLRILENLAETWRDSPGMRKELEEINLTKQYIGSK